MGILGKTIDKGNLAEELTKQTEEKVEKTEAKTEEKVEDKTEEVQVEEKEKQSEDTKKETDRADDFSFDAFNKKFETSFESEDDIKAIFEKASKLDGVQSELDTKAKKISELEDLTGKLDPMAWFANEDEFVRQQFLKQKSSELNESQINALSSLSPSRITQMSAEDALKTDLIVNEGLSSKEAEAYIESNFEGIYEEDADVGIVAKLKVQANNARTRLVDLYKGIEVPEKVDYSASVSQLKESWSTPLKEIVNGIDKIQLAEDLDFVVTNEMKQGIEQTILDELASGQIKPSEEAGVQVAGLIRSRLLESNMDKVVKSISADLEEKYKEKYRKEIHNDKDLNSDSRTSESTESNAQKMLRHL